MDTSVLLVGSVEFISKLMARVFDLFPAEINPCYDWDEVLPEIQKQAPDILIIQANQENNLNLCRQIKEQTQKNWLYCIFVEDQLQVNDECLRLNQGAEALENGADAYMAITPGASASTYDAENRLILAQIQTGLRQTRQFRQLLQTNSVLSTIAITDYLTQIKNRSTLKSELSEQIINARSSDRPLSLIMLDVDHFKLVNDNYGHLVGDRVLQILVARLRNELRSQDSFFRYGGEEFVIILSNTDAVTALFIAERLRSLIDKQSFSVQANQQLHITISLGVSTLNLTDDEQGTSLLKRADQNLLKAKSAGRNQVMTESQS
ncbi:MAG: GGDEF domain-containing protein [Crinalium sp.]